MSGTVTNVKHWGIDKIRWLLTVFGLTIVLIIMWPFLTPLTTSITLGLGMFLDSKFHLLLIWIGGLFFILGLCMRRVARK